MGVCTSFIKKHFLCPYCFEDDAAQDPIIPIPIPIPVQHIDEKNIYDNRAWCKYGDKCYSRNAEHLRKYRHPIKDEVFLEGQPDPLNVNLDSLVKIQNVPTGYVKINEVLFHISKDNSTNQVRNNPQYNVVPSSSKELVINSILLQVFPHENIIHNKAVSIRVNKRPDWLIKKDIHCIIIECDEHGHRRYKLQAEFLRMIEIHSELNVPCVFIRFNPDKYTKKNMWPFDSKFVKVNGNVNPANVEEFRNRMNSLLCRVQHYLSHPTICSISVEYLFFDE